MGDVKGALAKRAGNEGAAEVRLTKSMTIADMVRALEPEIKKALPTVLTPERADPEHRSADGIRER